MVNVWRFLKSWGNPRYQPEVSFVGKASCELHHFEHMTFPSEPQLARSFELIWDFAEPGGRMNLWPPNYPGIQDSDFWHSASFSS